MAGTMRRPESRSPKTEILLPICILAGGLGTRLGSLTRTTPKVLVPVAGQPFVFHQLRLLADNGAARVVFCVGYRGEHIQEAVGPSRFGLNLEYSYDSPALDGTLGAIRKALPLLGDRFLVLYGDTYLPIDYKDVQHKWLATGLPALMTVLRNDNRWGPSNVVFRRGRVLAHDKSRPAADMAWIDYGLGGLCAEVVEASPPAERDLSALYGDLARQRQLFGYPATKRFHEIGSPDALAETDRYLTSRATK
jgi:NDP-sugar pyrophosphorylase family protein